MDLNTKIVVPDPYVFTYLLGTVNFLTVKKNNYYVLNLIKAQLE